MMTMLFASNGVPRAGIIGRWWVCVRRCVLVHLIFFLFALSGGPAAASPPPGVSVGPAPAWIVPMEPGVDAPPAAGVQSGRECLLSHAEERLGPRGQESYFQGAWRIVSQPGLDAASQVHVELDPTYQTAVLHFVRIRRGGATIDRLDPAALKVIEREPNLERQVYDSRRSVVLFVPDLRVGDVLEYAYTKRGADPTLDGKFSGRVVLGTVEPVGRLYMRVLVPRGRSIRTSVHGPGRGSAALEPAIHEVPYGTEYVWDRVAPEPYPEEPNEPSSFVPVPWAELTEYASWREVADHARQLFKSAPLSPKTRRVVDGWRSEAATPSDFVLRAVRFVQDDVRYVGIEVGLDRRRPADPNVVFERRFGDCKDKSALLVALLDAAGIPAQPALASAPPSSPLEEMDPDLGAFDHAIVRVGPLEGNTYWVDATASGQGGGLERLRYSDLGWVLPLAEGRSALEWLVPEPTSEPSLVVRETFTLPEAANGAEGQLDVERIYQGSIADARRRWFQAQNQEQQRKYYLELYRAQFPSIRERGPLEHVDDRANDRFRVTGHYALPQVWSWDEPSQRFVVTTDPGLLEELLPDPGSAERKTPLAFPHPVHVRQLTTLSAPTLTRFTPADVSLGDSAFDLHFTSSYEDRTLTYTFDLASKRDSIAPEELAEHAAAIRKARAQIVRRLTVPALAPDGPNWPVIAGAVLLLPLLGWGARKAYRYRPPGKRKRAGEQRVIGGWLGLIALRLIVTPLQLLWNMRHATWMFSRRGWSAVAAGSHPILAYVSPVEIALMAALLVYTAVVLVVFLQRKRSFPRHYTVLTAAAVVFTFIDHAVADASGYATMEGSTIVYTTTVAFLLLAYVQRSRRVAETFVR